MKLADLQTGRTARVLSVGGAEAQMEDKLREVGFAEGDEIEVLHKGPLGGNPLAVRLNQTVIAVRISEAQFIDVEPIASSSSSEAAS